MISKLYRFLIIVFIFFLLGCKQEHELIPAEKIKQITIEIFEPKENLSETERELIKMGLIDLHKLIPELIIDLKYATEDNFFGFNAYGDFTKAYVQKECADKLIIAYSLLQRELPAYTFIIFDAARPLRVQRIMWNALDVPESRKHWYVANPERGSIHNYGMALDLTIADTDGQALDMGTEFDYFGEIAFPRYTQKHLESGELTEDQANNRFLLFQIMEEAGFTVSRTEWWHFNAASLEKSKNKYQIIE